MCVCVFVHLCVCDKCVGYRLNDGYWHTVDLAARDNLLTLTIDEEEGSPLKITNPFTIRTGDRYFFGGEAVNEKKSFWHFVNSIP